MIPTHTTTNSMSPTVSFDGQRSIEPPKELLSAYQSLLTREHITWTYHPKLMRMIGRGGQGVVFLSQRRGADGFTVPIALKVFSPERFEDVASYQQAMQRIARVAAHIAQIQHDNLLDVQDFYDRNQIRVMAMEWVDGFDLRWLLENEHLQAIRHRVGAHRWRYINDVIVTTGDTQARMKPGIAVAIVRDCLAGLAALHRSNIVHSDIKPGNIMIKMTGNAKIIDTGAAFELDDPPLSRSCTPVYAAPEVLEGRHATPRSDLASIGYVLIELLSGQSPFNGITDYSGLLAAKRNLHRVLHTVLPREVTSSDLLLNFCRRLINPDPRLRFPNAEAAELVKGGAAAFHRQLVMGDLASEYANEIRLWIKEVAELSPQDS